LDVSLRAEGYRPIPIDGRGQRTAIDDVGVHLADGFVVHSTLAQYSSVSFGKRRGTAAGSHGIWNMAM